MKVYSTELDDLQTERENAHGVGFKAEIQKRIDNHFFKNPPKQKRKKKKKLRIPKNPDDLWY